MRKYIHACISSVSKSSGNVKILKNRFVVILYSQLVSRVDQVIVVVSGMCKIMDTGTEVAGYYIRVGEATCSYCVAGVHEIVISLCYICRMCSIVVFIVQIPTLDFLHEFSEGFWLDIKKIEKVTFVKQEEHNCEELLSFCSLAKSKNVKGYFVYVFKPFLEGFWHT